MQDGWKRAILTTVAISLAMGIVALATMSRGKYSFLDFLRGKDLPPNESPTEKKPKKPKGNGVPETVTLPVADPVEPGEVPGLEKVDQEKRFLAEMVMPAVVNIDTVRSSAPDVSRAGLGSGVIVSREGHVITNEHVIRDASTITVTTDALEVYEAKLVGFDPAVDIAVLAIQSEKKDFPALRFADDWKLDRGQLVFVAGNPYGLKGSFIGGEVSGELRKLKASPFQLWQVHADANPGTSGGPLVDIYGRIVGINKAMLSIPQMEKLRQIHGVMLAVRANDAQDVFQRIIGEGSPARGWLGVEWDYLNQALAPTFGIDPNTKGAVIVNVVEGSPAEKADLQLADVVYKVDGDLIESSDELVDQIQHMRVGQKTTLTVFREGQSLDLKVIIGASPNDTINRLIAGGSNELHGPGTLPASQLSDEEIEELIGIKTRVQSMEGSNGKSLRVLIVHKVLAFSPAQGVIQPNDLILAVHRDRVSRVEDFMAKMVNLTREGKGAALYISRNGKRMFKPVGPAVKSK